MLPYTTLDYNSSVISRRITGEGILCGALAAILDCVRRQPIWDHWH